MLEWETAPAERCDPGQAQRRGLFDNQPPRRPLPPRRHPLQGPPGSTGLLRRTDPHTFCWHLGHTHTPLGAVLRGGSRQPRW